jgi:hypothetical protein
MTRGRKPNAVATVTVKEACDVLSFVARGIKEVNISFDSSRADVEIIWGQREIRCASVQMPKVLDSLRLLDSLTTDEF